HRFLVKLRIDKARELLESTDLPIIEIAAQVGYDDPSYLARLFRREVGVTPAAYRRERRR
ncbi:helix-turn-helix transcriptional regulator, partial [Acinetobacter baumannii]